jgi:hypothetical protein
MRPDLSHKGPAREGQSSSRPNDALVDELTMPVWPGDATRARQAFRSHFRSLVIGSLLRSAEAQLAQERAAQHRLRAWQAERTVQRLRALGDLLRSEVIVPSPGFGPGLRSLTTVAWLVAGAVLIVDIVAFGIQSWANTVGEIAMMALTIVWFFVFSGSPVHQGAVTEPAATVPEAAPEPRRQVFYFSERDVCVSLDDDSGLTLKAVTRAGEPVQLSADDSRDLADLLRRLALPRESGPAS